MRKFIGVVFGLIVLAVVVIAAIASLQPSTFTIERSTVIAAPPDRILPFLDDFHHFKQWSPWEHLDPNMTANISGATSGVGSVYQWQGNSKAGAGRMEIVSENPSQVVEKLDFLKPFESHNTITYTLTPEDSSTKVTWSMSGPAGYLTKVMTLFTSMDKMVGPDFERGLASLKTAVEAPPQS